MRAKIHSEISTVGKTVLDENKFGEVREVIHTQLLQYENKVKAFLFRNKKELTVNSLF
jgi:hypothetical protein